MLLPLFYYFIGFILYIFLYEYYRNNNKKKIARLDFLQNLENALLDPIPITTKRSFDSIKKDLNTYFYFNRLRIAFGIDLSASNEWQGQKTFQGQSLHKTHTNKIYNPYQKVINQLGIIFEDIFASKLEYSCFTFGDEHSKDFTYFPIIGSGDQINNYQSVLDAYFENTKNAVLSGPTSFIPMIKQLMIYGIHCRKDFTMLIILTDELKISHEDPSTVEVFRTLTHLSNVCLIIIGVGDGPWSKISYEEHRLRESVFKKSNKKKMKKCLMDIDKSKYSYDNFHFIDFNLTKSVDKTGYNINLARAIFTKLPTQLKQAFQHNNNEQKPTQA